VQVAWPEEFTTVPVNVVFVVNAVVVVDPAITGVTAPTALSIEKVSASVVIQEMIAGFLEFIGVGAESMHVGADGGVGAAALVAVQADMPLVPVSCPPFWPAQTQVTVASLVDAKILSDGAVPAEHRYAPVKVSGPPGYGYIAWLTGAFMEAVPQMPSTGVAGAV